MTYLHGRPLRSTDPSDLLPRTDAGGSQKPIIVQRLSATA